MVEGMGVSTILIRAIVEAVERAGAKREDLFRAAEVDPSRLENASGRFELEEYDRVQTSALAVTGDPAFGLRMAEHTSESAFDLLAALLAHAPTMREAIALARQFGSIAVDGASLVPRDSGAQTTIRYAFPRSSEASDRMHAEFVMGGFVRLARLFCGPHAAPLSVGFEHARPAHHREYARFFGGVEHFAQAATSITFGHDVIDRRHLHQHPEFYSLLRMEAERQLERVTEGLRLSDQLRQYLLARPAANIPDVSSVSRDLGMSERSLRRRLSSEGTSYRQLVQETLEMSAGRMLREPQRSIQETAIALGFADAAAFHRAFKRWTGLTPKQYRETRGAR
jgi:AraC-like DNA-binding protein